MNFRLVHAGWDKLLDDALSAHSSNLRIVCPFIQKRAAGRLLRRGRPEVLQVITRFNLVDFSEGVSDIAALRLLLEGGAQIRGIRSLHAKLYLFGASRVIVTSANLTDAALLRNHEFGFVAEDGEIVAGCRHYFDDLWNRAGRNLSAELLTDWEHKVTSHLASGARRAVTAGLGDEGTDAGLSSEPIAIPGWIGDSEQAFVKFFGRDADRADRSLPILEEVRSSGCHWACTYPKGKRPRQVHDGAVMFMGRLVKDDILIYGRAVGMHHEPGRDDASEADIEFRPWKAQWPHYVRVHHGELVAGNLSNGISLNDLMNALEGDSFASTRRNAAKGAGNIDPRKAYLQQPAVELSSRGSAWLNDRLEGAFARYGKLSPASLEQLDWPTLPVGPPGR